VLDGKIEAGGKTPERAKWAFYAGFNTKAEALTYIKGYDRKKFRVRKNPKRDLTSVFGAFDALSGRTGTGTVTEYPWLVQRKRDS